MSIIVKGMEMPQTCFKCKLSRITPSIYAFCPLNEKCYPADETPPSDCPLIEVPEWIPVTEKLPEEYKDVLCYYEYFRYGDFNCMFRTIDRGYYGNGIWGGEAGQGHKNKVLAWMPLPKPPKDGET